MSIKLRITLLALLIPIIFPAYGEEDYRERSSPDIPDMVDRYLKGEDTYSLDDIAECIIYGSDLDMMLDAGISLFKGARRNNDNIGTLYGSTLQGVCYLYKNEADSCLYYLNNSLAVFQKIKRAGERQADERCSKIMIVTYDFLGLSYINLTIDYYKASEYFLQALEWIKRGRKYELYASVLSNLSIVSYYREDPLGLQYAQMCYEYAQKHPLFTFIANYSMALMLFVTKNYPKALEHARMAVSELEEHHGNSNDMMMAYTIYGKILTEMNMKEEARAAFEKGAALPPGEYSDAAGLYLNYGKYYLRIGETEKALDIMLKGLNSSHQHNNLVHLNELYKNIAAIYEMKGDPSNALEYYKLHTAISDSTYIQSKEFALAEMNVKHRISQYENELRKREIEQIESEKRQQFLIYLILVICILFMMVWYSLKKKNKYYERIVRQLRENQELNRQLTKNTQEEKGEEIFGKVTEMMKREKLYRDGEMTIEKLAALLNTNRSYLSRSINDHTGMNFNKFLNSYRVDEAMERLSEKSEDILLKSLALDLGFNSLTSFNRVFTDKTGISPSAFRKKVRELEEKGDLYKW